MLAFTLVAAACGGGTTEVVQPAAPAADATTPADASAPAATAAPAVEPTAVPAQGSVEDVAAATVKIIAEGTFVAPGDIEQSSVAGVGSGFIIDSAGTIVTNNHVVTGAAFLEVFLGDDPNPRNARILGVSECNDLAVLDLDGDGYEFLEFRTDAVSPGLSVFSAGFPLNLDSDFATVDYTLTAGIVSNGTGSGDTNWTSVDSVIEHDARIRGGNSGGPLVDEQGRVVGINFAGEDTADLNLAISAQQAQSIIEALKGGDVESLGINGQAVVTEEFSGIWVAGVASGTPADRAGLVPGDIIVSMEGVPLAEDGTMATYCDIVRTKGDDGTIAIEVVRPVTEEFLAGQINGEPLALAFSFAEELSDEMASGTPSGGGYSEYVFVTDDTGSVGVEVPVEWNDTDGQPNDEFGESIWASPDLASFRDTWDTPGIIVERSSSLTSADIDSVLDVWTLDACEETSGREDFQTTDEVFTGKWEVYTGCGGTETAVLILAVSPPDGQSVVRMFIQIVSDADLDAADRALASFDSVS